MAPERVATPDWPRLKGNYPAELVEGVRKMLDRADSSVIDPVLLGSIFHSDITVATQLLEELAGLGLLVVKEQKLCGNQGCGVLATAEDQAAGVCPNCGKRYEELDTSFKTTRAYTLPAGRQGRDISWVVTVHGMNTDGPWQQDFSWLIANKLKYSAPVLILKYPVFRVMALFERTQRLLVPDLGMRLRAAIGHARQRGDELSGTPDVVLHSFGTLLFSRLLLDPCFVDLKFGRVILAGSIVRPDYDWAQHLSSGRVEEVVNHCGDRDAVVGIAQLTIPGSGPSGRVGFVDRSVRNVVALGYGHGTFFEIEPMKSNLAQGGAWDRFLTYPAKQLAAGHEMSGPVEWSPGVVAAAVRILARLLAVAGVGPLLWFGMAVWSAVKTLASGKSA